MFSGKAAGVTAAIGAFVLSVATATTWVSVATIVSAITLTVIGAWSASTASASMATSGHALREALSLLVERPRWRNRNSTATTRLISTAALLMTHDLTREEAARVMHMYLEVNRRNDESHAEFLESMARFAPQFGILGSTLNLVLLTDRQAIDGATIAASFPKILAPILFGMALARLIYGPAAIRLRRRADDRLLGSAALVESFLTDAVGDANLVLPHGPERQREILLAADRFIADAA